MPRFQRSGHGLQVRGRMRHQWFQAINKHCAAKNHEGVFRQLDKFKGGILAPRPLDRHIDGMSDGVGDLKASPVAQNRGQPEKECQQRQNHHPPRTDSGQRLRIPPDQPLRQESADHKKNDQDDDPLCDEIQEISGTGGGTDNPDKIRPDHRLQIINKPCVDRVEKKIKPRKR